MFTGLIATTAQLTARSSQEKAGQLIVAPRHQFDELKRGESIAVNGACLTLERQLPGGELEFHVLTETLAKTNLGQLPLGSEVNLERALAVGDRLGGHWVTGHVDAVGELLDVSRLDNDYIYKVSVPEAIAPYLVPKGSIAIDGTSLTLVEVTNEYFTVHLIPVTSADTALLRRAIGDPLNLEADLLGKYVRRQFEVLGVVDSVGGVTMDKLRNAGWL